jgi:hypothetical protein
MGPAIAYLRWRHFDEQPTVRVNAVLKALVRENAEAI